MNALAVIWAPVRSLGEAAEECKVLPGFLAVALYAALGLILQAVFIFGGAMEVPFGAQDMQPPPGAPTEIFENVVVAAQVATLIFAVLGPFVWWIMVSLVMQLVTSLFGGTGSLFCDVRRRWSGVCATRGANGSAGTLGRAPSRARS